MGKMALTITLYEMGTMALVMKWVDGSSYELGKIAFVMKWVRWLLL